MNLLHIITDQLSSRYLGCYGCSAAATPNIDRLARRGVRFDNCFANHPVCMPSRASTITGRSAPVHGLYFNGWELDPAHPTFPRLLQRGGVQTLGLGKFHLQSHDRSSYNNVLQYGFDHAEVTEDTRAGDWLDWVQAEHPDCYQQALATVWPKLHMHNYGRPPRDLVPEIERARKAWPNRVEGSRGYVTPIPERACQTRWIGDRALSLIDRRDTDRPFYMHMSFVDPHDPYDPPARYLERIDPEAVPMPLHSEDPSHRRALERFDEVHFVNRFKHLSPDDWRELRRHYLASLSFIDDQVGRVLDHLEEAGLVDRTMIVFTSDHGDMLGDFGLPTKGAWHLDACMRVPLIVAGPGVARGTSVDRHVSNLDLFPTITDYAGVHHDVPVEGQSLRPLLEGTGDVDRPDATLVSTYGNYGVIRRHMWARTACTPEARLTVFGDGSGMLFDLADDPDEQVNLFDARHPSTLQTRMTMTLLGLLEDRFDPLPDRGRLPGAGS